MSKEVWLESYECAVEDAMDVEGWDRESAIRHVDSVLETDPHYLDDYHLTIIDAFKE